MVVFTHVMSYDIDWDRLGTMGRAPRIRETLLDFRESCQVTQHSRVFRGLTGCQRDPQVLGRHMSFDMCRWQVENGDIEVVHEVLVMHHLFFINRPL